jgi:glycosyltransferase involved in cell wall biosynthesis
MRVVLASAQFPPVLSGYSRVAERLSTELKGLGYDIQVLSLGAGCSLRGRMALLDRVGRELLDTRPRVVHVIGPSPIFSEQVIAASGRRSIPSVYQVFAFAGLRTYYDNPASRLIDGVYTATLFRRSLARATRVVSPTRQFAESIGVDGGRVEVIPLGVSVGPGVQPPGLRSQPEGTTSSTKVLFVGQLRPYKGLHVLLHAIAEARRSGVSCTLTAVGEGPSRNRLESMAQRLGLESAVSFLGQIPDSSLQVAYRSHDVLVLPSLFGESYGLVLLEARAAGMEVIASDLPGVSEVVGALGGRVFRPGSASALAGLIGTVRAREPGTRSPQDWVSERFSWSKVALTYSRLYESL